VSPWGRSATTTDGRQIRSLVVIVLAGTHCAMARRPRPLPLCAVKVHNLSQLLVLSRIQACRCPGKYPEVAHELFGTLDDRLDGLDRFLELLAALGRPQTFRDTAIAAGRLTAGDPRQYGLCQVPRLHVPLRRPVGRCMLGEGTRRSRHARSCRRPIAPPRAGRRSTRAVGRRRRGPREGRLTALSRPARGRARVPRVPRPGRVSGASAALVG